MILTLLIRIMLSFFVISACSNEEQGEKEQIISLVFNSQIGDVEHFGSAPPVPALPPDFDTLNVFKTEEKAKKVLTSKEWQEYFKEHSNYDEKVSTWKERMKSLDRKIIFFDESTVSEHHKQNAEEFLASYGFENDFLAAKTEWDKSDILNKSKYELVNWSDFPDLKLDSIHVGVFQISDVGFNQEKDNAIVYYEWFCGRHCGSGNLAILKKTHGRWKIEEILNLWVS